ncbi:hypothetical protein Rhopal_006975-T1 [Rhodotorula paludigena]|uniref:Uncharacterized protein n=1 Tax=Rhodotorula paludigena TaxID=86838 RepID=A0AAV5GMV4_9BASI|nr:hypothetical protein Rhopal_006975-T1 [Rhodotorula paludigena]
MSTQPTPPPEKAPNHDLEAGNLGLLDSNGGASLRRQISVQLTSEQFERLYLQPGGAKAKGDLAKVRSHAQIATLFCDLLCSPSCLFDCSAMYFMGGLGLTLAGIFEWVLGNTFTSVVFITFGAFWLSFGFLLQPSQGIASALDATSVEYNGGIAMYLIWWSVLVLIYLIASLRTNAVFVALFTFLENIKSAYGDTSNINALLKAAGAFAFLTTAMGWYLQVVLIFDSVGIPIKLPVGDMSTFMARRRHID